MDAFEQLVAEIMWSEGYWVQTSVKVQLTAEEKEKIGRRSSPRWELDVVAYKAATNEIVVLECKSFLDSVGVQWNELQDGHGSSRYKLFREPVLRDVILGALQRQLAVAGLCPATASLSLGLVAAKIKRGDSEKLAKHFADRDWRFFGPDWLRERLTELSKQSYQNQVSSVVAKLLLRLDKASEVKSSQSSSTPSASDVGHPNMRQRPSNAVTRYLPVKRPTALDGYPQRIEMWDAVQRLGSADRAELLAELERAGHRRPNGAPVDESYCRKELTDMTRRGFLSRDDA